MKVIPIFCLSAVVGGLVGLLWYDQLPPLQKQDADDRASDMTRSLFESIVEEVTPSKVSTVISLVRKFAGIEHRDS
jgi:hypothetical protein